MRISELERFEAKVKKTSTCWIWTAFRDKDGYGKFDSKAAHRAAYRLYVGLIDQGMFVCHKCDNPSCVRPDHLFLGTNRDNILDCKSKGRHVYGERTCNARLTAEEVVEIRNERISGMKWVEIAKKHGVSMGAVWHAATRSSWAWVQ